MSNFYGADAEQLRLLARDLGTQAEQLESIVARLSSRVAGVAWSGPDAQRFTAEGNERLSVLIRSVANGLRDASESAIGNARAQADVSGGYGGGAFLPNSTFPGLPDSPSLELSPEPNFLKRPGDSLPDPGILGPRFKINPQHLSPPPSHAQLPDSPAIPYPGWPDISEAFKDARIRASEASG